MGRAATNGRSSPPDAAGEMHASALDGTLVLRDGCLYLQSRQRWLPVFPHDIDWDGRAQTLRVPPWEASVRVGEQVVLAGGEVPHQPDIHTVPDGCDLPPVDSGPGGQGLAGGDGGPTDDHFKNRLKDLNR